VDLATACLTLNVSDELEGGLLASEDFDSEDSLLVLLELIRYQSVVENADMHAIYPDRPSYFRKSDGNRDRTFLEQAPQSIISKPTVKTVQRKAVLLKLRITC
jgi:hypothetical protein